MNLSGLKRIIKNNKVLGPVAYDVKHKIEEEKAKVHEPNVAIPEITPIMPRRAEKNTGLRLNLLCPSVDKKHVFGGIATALTFFRELVKETGADARIIVTDAMVDVKNNVELDGFVVVESDVESEEKYQIVPFANRGNATFPVSSQDVFMATGWWTAYNIYDTIKWQANEFGIEEKPLIYFIQDFEPGFYAWSSRYMMADSTYRFDIKTIAIFNSGLLKDYFVKNDYQFYKSFYFDPVLNSGLKKYLVENTETVKREKKIIIYGRPSVERNAFELIIAALNDWAARYDKSSQWEVISAGEEYKSITLCNGKQVSSLGKLSIEDYAKTMLSTSIGISLMVSPHPSYPPLEMSTFGIKTITNCYNSKDLGSFNDNIVSIKACSARTISETLAGLCDSYSEEGKIITDSDYFNNEAVFADIIKELGNVLK